MPIHEYRCADCDQSFEELILRRSDEEEVACPACKSRQVSRLISRPAAARSSGAGGSPPAPARGCGPVG